MKEESKVEPEYESNALIFTVIGPPYERYEEKYKCKKLIENPMEKQMSEANQGCIEDHKNLNSIQIRKLNAKNLPKIYFSKVYDHAIHSNEEPKKEIVFDINFIEFQINYKTEFGFDICLLGSCETLGKWSPNLSYY